MEPPMDADPESLSPGAVNPADRMGSRRGAEDAEAGRRKWNHCGKLIGTDPERSYLEFRAF